MVVKTKNLTFILWLLLPFKAYDLYNYLPEKSRDYCKSLVEKYILKIQVVNPRKSVLGTYYRKSVGLQKRQIIRINGDLPPTLFLVVFLHEVAHWLVDDKRLNESSHGPAWQDTFKELMRPVMSLEFFKADQLQLLQEELYEKKTGACFSHKLTRLLRGNYEEMTWPMLSELAVGDFFYHNDHPFLLLEKRRSRAVCLELSQGRNLLVQMSANVRPANFLENRVMREKAESFKPLGTLQKGEQFAFLGTTYTCLGPSDQAGHTNIRKYRGKIIFSLSNNAFVQVLGMLKKKLS